MVGDYHFQAADEHGTFANLVSVSFSAFDDAEPLPASRSRMKSGVRYTYVGLKVQRHPDDDRRTTTTKPPSTLSREFGESVDECTTGVRLRRWQQALRALEGDPIFAEANVSRLAERRGDDIRKDAQRLFNNLSSGHKIVLLSITRLVESVEERTLVLLDEPEAHLHPPLLSAFIRALSDLLIDRNGVALIATHSPVVLQEVPRSAVWKLRRAGRIVNAERPEIETFGENVGILTREVFGLEVSQSGFHRMLQDAAEEGLSYDEIVDRFGGALGGEARSLAQALVAVRDARAAR
ncbi:AAA family ATPase [Blastococcus sp. LR1]|uniref:AAA family ATPase n=1 Tax=Blastococcus sp. LR1 TaxID=2877000 RepID=UPI001CCB0AAD|nr:AAA family ATPase [Blastococcus sp. LR1]MCA0146660.1 ATP-binding protein [Blastococcus sp. LR1]